VLLSMTGQGQGRRQYGTAEITAEVRAVNNRHLKLQSRTSEGLGGLEPQIEALVRKSLKRGSLQLGVQLTGGEFESEYQLRESVLTGYIHQCRNLAEKMGIEADFSIRDLLVLPGIVAEKRSLTSGQELPDDLVDSVLGTVADALACLNRMRSAEGDAMQAELERQLDALLQLTSQIEQRAPQVLEEYRQRLETRLAKALAEVGSQLKEADLVRELLFMADKADVREEVVRLRSHVAQFQGLLATGESQGRKLDFLIQEMFRESNTIGSKSGDAEIAQRVVDIKTIIEQMRELVQNVE
jgi:uncharacterized protein (TIGR00255 family)